MSSETEDGSCCVLIVADDAARRAHMRQLLSAASNRAFSFSEAGNGGAGIAAILASAGRHPDCVLLDDPLPDLDARQVLEAIAERDSLARFPVVVIAARSARDKAGEILKAGAQDFLERENLTAETLSRAVENAIARFSLVRQLRGRDANFRDSETLLRLALEASNTGFWTWDMRSDAGTWSAEVYPIMGVAAGGGFEITGATVFEMIHRQDLERVRATLQGAIASGSGFACEFRVVRPNGEVVWVENRGRTRYGEGGEPIGMLGTITDVTARKLTEEELRRREFELRTLAENTPDIYARFDREHRHVFVNAAVERATGLSREAFLGKTNRELGMPPERCDEWDAALGFVFETGRPHAITFDYDCSDGKHYFAARLVPEMSPEGNVSHVLVVTHDVTDRERYEQTLRDAAQRKNEFLATLAHELRNPLAPIRTGLQVLSLAVDDAGARTKAIAAMERQISHLVRLVDDLRDVSHISRGVVELRCEPVEVRAIVDQALEFSQSYVQAGHHELRVNLPEAPLWINGDPTRLAQAVSNLLNNAAKYTPSGGRIELTASVDAGDAVICVADNGIGISSDDLSKVFDLFAQVDPSRERAQGGLGIGLSLVRKLVTLHGGTVTATSAGKGRGSAFTLRLPAAAARSSRGTVPPPASMRRDLKKSLRILVVDDNPDAAEVLADLLGLMGNETQIALDGPTAIATTRAFSPDLIFLDIGLPGMDGHEVASRLRAEGVLGGTVLVALTGWGGTGDQRAVVESGFDHHLTKPVEPGALSDIVEYTVNQRGSTSRAVETS